MSRSVNDGKHSRGRGHTAVKEQDRAFYVRSDERNRKETSSFDRKRDNRRNGKNGSGERKDERRDRSHGRRNDSSVRSRTYGKTFEKGERRSERKKEKYLAESKAFGRESKRERAGRGTEKEHSVRTKSGNGSSSFSKKNREAVRSGFKRADVLTFDSDFYGKTVSEDSREYENIIFGRNPVMEAVRSGRSIDKILIANKAEGSVHKIAGKARERNIRVQYVEKNVLDRAAGGAMHQGVIAYVSDYEYAEVEDILGIAEERGEDPLVVVLDGIEDPHNLGAIIRTADAAGAHGVIIPMRRAASVTPAVERAAAGAAEYMAVARVVNISSTIDMLKKRGIWVVSADMDGVCIWDSELKGPTAVVIGGEGSGISRLVKQSCDQVISLPMNGGVNSLNASNAAALMMYEIVRQRRG